MLGSVKLVHIKDSRSYHFDRVAPHADRVLLFSTIAAVLIHALFIFGISFEQQSTPEAVVQEVTTVLTENLQKNEKADFIANASQQGGGKSEEKQRFENNTTSPVESDEVNPTDDIVTTPQQKRQQAFQESYLRTTLSWEKVSKENDNKKDDKAAELEEQDQRLRLQIVTLTS